jgi:hypothetical protein
MYWIAMKTRLRLSHATKMKTIHHREKTHKVLEIKEELKKVKIS